MACLGFDNLLQRIACEHAREVSELRAEIARLRGGHTSERSSSANSQLSPGRQPPVPNTLEDPDIALGVAYASNGDISASSSPSGVGLLSQRINGRVHSASASTAAASSRVEPDHAPEGATNFSPHAAERGGAAGSSIRQKVSPRVVPRLSLPNSQPISQAEQAPLLGNQHYAQLSDELPDVDDVWVAVPDAGALASVLSAVPSFQEHEEAKAIVPEPRPADVRPLQSTRERYSSRQTRTQSRPGEFVTFIGQGPSQALCLLDSSPLDEDTGRYKVRAEQPKSPRQPISDKAGHLADKRTPRELDDHEMVNWEVLLKAVADRLAQGAVPKMHSDWQEEPNNGRLSRAMLGLKGVIDTQKFQKQGEQHDFSSGGTVNTLSIERSWCWPIQKCWSCRLRDFQAIHPNNKFRVAWDLLGVVILGHDLIMIPLVTFFDNDTVTLGRQYDGFKIKSDWFTASFWTADIAVSFFTGFHNSGGFVQRRMPEVVRHYLRGWFPIDCSIVTVDWLHIAIDSSTSTQYMSSVQAVGKVTAKILRVCRLFRFMKMNKNVSELLETIHSEYMLTGVMLMKNLCAIVLVNHYIACFWYGLSTVSASMRNGSWIEYYLEKKDSIHDDLWLSYSASLHWSLTQFTPASMEIFPRNACERFFNVGIIVLALLVFSSFVSSITNAMNHIRNINATNTEQETKIRRYFRENSIHHDLASRVWHFVRNNRKVNVRRLRLGRVPGLEGLPIRLKDELLQAQHLPVLEKHPFFKLYFGATGGSTKKRCVQLAIQEADPLQSGVALDAIFPTGKVAKSTGLRNESYVVKKMVFCLFGSLEYNDPNGECIDDDDPGCTLEPGEWACEATLWLQEASLQGRLVAGSSGCDALLLDSDAFRMIAKEDPETHLYVAKYASLFTNLFTDAMQMSVNSSKSDLEEVEEEAEDKPRSTNILFNNAEVLETAARDAFAEKRHGSLMVIGTIKGFSQRNSKIIRSSTRSGRGSTATAEHEAGEAAPWS